MKNFALIGASGYIAPRHMQAIKDTGNSLSVALDHSDSVGVIDSYFPDAAFFTEFERFDRHIDKLRRSKNPLDYLSICSPNYLHDAHIRYGLRNNIDVVSEKPLVLNPWNIESLEQLERETGRKVNNVLQLRLHKDIQQLKKKVEEGPVDKVYDFDLTYITSRGNWYYASWKGDEAKSGGIATNIGIHFYDMLSWVFGAVKENVVHVSAHDRAAGYLEFEKARVRWFLSINSDTLPKEVIEQGKTTYRSMKIGGEEIEFSDGFSDLHTKSYKAIIDGKGFGIEAIKSATDVVYSIRNQEPIGLKGEYHPLSKLPMSKHPFEISLP